MLHNIYYNIHINSIDKHDMFYNVLKNLNATSINKTPCTLFHYLGFTILKEVSIVD